MVIMGDIINPLAPMLGPGTGYWLDVDDSE